ncbi:MAG: D-aminoacyl-tRNA deacylase [Nanoarchaeota archaeon]
MQIALISSEADPASLTIRRHLEENISFRDAGEQWYSHPVLVGTLGSHDCTLFTQDLHTVHFKGGIDADLILFLSTHTSKKGVPTLSAHAPGNWGPADLGGEPRQLSMAAPAFMKAYLSSLEDRAPPGYDVVQEVTHHGPLCMTPCAFVEIGSGPGQWNDPAAGKAVAEALVETLSHPLKECPSAVGIGGLHTCDSFRKTVKEQDIALGHACPKYALPSLGSEMLQQAIERTQPEASRILVAWKGLGKEKERIARIIDEAGLPVTKVK